MTAEFRTSRGGAVLLAGFLALTALLLLGCPAKRGSWSDGWYSQDLKLAGPTGQQELQLRYQPGRLGTAWQEGTSPPGDIAYFNPELGATIYSDSSCGSRYDDAPLMVLLNHLLFGVTEVEMLREEEPTLSGRAALMRVARARLDGVPVQLAATVTKNGPCVFDLVYLSPPQSFAAGLDDYTVFYSGLAVEYRQ